MQTNLPLFVTAISVQAGKKATPMANEPPDVWPPHLPPPKWCWGNESRFSFQSRAWKSKGDQQATRTPIVRGPFTLQQVQALLQAAMRSMYPARDVALLSLFLETGIRLSELEELTWQDFA